MNYLKISVNSKSLLFICRISFSGVALLQSASAGAGNSVVSSIVNLGVLCVEHGI